MNYVYITSDHEYDDDLIDLKSLKYISKCTNLKGFINTQSWGIPASGLLLLAPLNLVILKISTVNLLILEFTEIIKDNFRNLQVLGITNFRDELIHDNKSELLLVLSGLNLKLLELDW